MHVLVYLCSLVVKGGSRWAAEGEVMGRMKNWSKQLSQQDLKEFVFFTHAEPFYRGDLYLEALLYSPSWQAVMVETKSTGHQRYEDEVKPTYYLNVAIQFLTFCLSIKKHDWLIFVSNQLHVPMICMKQHKRKVGRGIRVLLHILLVPVCLHLMHFSQVSIAASLLVTRIIWPAAEVVGEEITKPKE